MKKVGFITLVWLFVLAGKLKAQQKYGHINSEDILVVMPEYKQLSITLDSKKKQYSVQLQSMSKEYEQKTKEIGIRKVLGASVGGIVQMLSKDFLKLVFIAAIIAFPVAWWAMHKWLSDFAYRVDIGWWVFPVAGVIAGLIALLTISFQSIKAAIANPVKSLRTE